MADELARIYLPGEPMTTRPTQTIRYARAKVTAPNGDVTEGQTSETPDGRVEVRPQFAPDGEPTTYGPGEVVMRGGSSWAIQTADGEVVVERSAGGCGSCGGRR
jgi:hypothetical protein